MTLKAAVVFGAGGTANNWVVDDFASINGQQFVKLGRELIYDVSAKWNSSGSNTLTATSDVRGGVYLSDYKVVLSVEVPAQIVPDAGMVGSLGDMVPSNNGEKGEKHFVSPPNLLGGSDGNYLTFKAEGITATQFQNLLQWDGGEAVAGDPLKRRVPRGSAGKTVLKVVTKTDTKEVAKLNAWVVRANVALDSSNGAQQPYEVANLKGAAQIARIFFVHTITPNSILTDADRPDLTGEASGPGSSPCKDLQAGANAQWDGSRQVYTRVDKNRQFALTGASINCADLNFPAYPTDNAIGNDDGDTEDEDNNPAPGYLKSDDRPGRVIDPQDGAVGDEVVFNLFFREFTRLKVGETWYRISDPYLWKVSFGFKKILLQNSSTAWVRDSSTSRLETGTN